MMLLPFAMVRVVVQSVLRRRDENVYVDERKQDHEETANGRRVSEKAEAGRRLLGLSGSRSCRSQRMLTGALAAFDERIKSSEAREFEL